ncbi:hypothetical protein SNS2_4826 [Streptomyces netropsis]|nr:hypothetical protein SNS2_4826 [Streptomyces netropsis]
MARSRSGGPGGEGLEQLHGLRGPLVGDEEVVVVAAPATTLQLSPAWARAWATAAVRPTASRAEWTRRVIQPATYAYARPAASASSLRSTRVSPSSSATVTTGVTPAGAGPLTTVKT